MKAVVYALLTYKYVIILGLHLYALDWRLSQENMSLQVDFLLKPFEAYNRMCFRIRLLKRHFYFYFFLQWPHCQLHCCKLSVDMQLWMALSPNVSLEKEEKDRGVRAEIEAWSGPGKGAGVDGRGIIYFSAWGRCLSGSCSTASLPLCFLYLLF